MTKKHVSASLGLTHTVIYRKLFINLYCRSLLKPYLITFYSNIAQPHLTLASTKPKAVFYEYTTEGERYEHLSVLSSRKESDLHIKIK